MQYIDYVNGDLAKTQGLFIVASALTPIHLRRTIPLPQGEGGEIGDVALEGLNVVFGEIDR